jgi:dTDP-4-amino-4,6-dideoxygalactose transaminase
MPVHLFGQSADMDALMRLAGKHGLRVIEDAAQALGAGYRGRPVGGIGDFGTFSFFPSKNLGALGDAGLLVTQDDALAEKARLLRVHGAKPKYVHHLLGANFRMDPLQAAILSVKLPFLDGYHDARRRHAAAYTEQWSALPGVRVADPAACGCIETMMTGAGAGAGVGVGAGAGVGAARLILPVAYPHNEMIWNQYTLRVPGEGRREALRTWLQERGVASEIYYPVPLHRQPCFLPPSGHPPRLPVSEQLASEVLSVPVYPELTPDQINEVIQGVASFIHG